MRVKIRDGLELVGAESIMACGPAQLRAVAVVLVATVDGEVSDSLLVANYVDYFNIAPTLQQAMDRELEKLDFYLYGEPNANLAITH